MSNRDGSGGERGSRSSMGRNSYSNRTSARAYSDRQSTRTQSDRLSGRSYSGRSGSSRSRSDYSSDRVYPDHAYGSRAYSSSAVDELDDREYRRAHDAGTYRASRGDRGSRNAGEYRRAHDDRSSRDVSEHRGSHSVRGSHDAGAEGARPRSSQRVAPSKKRHRGVKIFVAALLVVACVGAGVAFGYYRYVNDNLHAGLNEEDLEKYLVQTDLTNEPFYMLFMGTDESEERDADESFGGSFRTDSIILARIDPVNKKATLLSIHRDSLVDLGEYGTQKINAAHAFGGAALSVKAVSELAGVSISHYAELNFDGFEDIVDALGGVEVDVPVEIDDEDAGGHLDAGLQTLNGEQALILCRSRNTYSNAADPDSMRAANQRLVLSAIANKVLSSDVATISKSVTAISNYFKTDLSVSDIIGLAQAMSGMDTSADLYTAMEPVTSTYENGGWYTYTNKEEFAEMIERMNQGLPPLEHSEVDEQTGTVIATSGGDDASESEKYAWVSVKNGTSKTGRAEAATALLQKNGFVNAFSGTANGTSYDKTMVIYDTTAQKYEAEQIVKALGQGTAVKNDGDWVFDGNFLVIIGSDWDDSLAPSASSSSASATSATAGTSSASTARTTAAS